MKNKSLEYSPLPGAEAADAIHAAVALAKGRMTRVHFEIGDIQIRVRYDSDAVLVHRDWQRAWKGHIMPRCVGPYPMAVLPRWTLNEEAETEAVWEREREYEKEYQARAGERALAACPQMSRDEADWQAALDVANDNLCLLARFKQAEAWARLMEAELAKGNTVAEVMGVAFMQTLTFPEFGEVSTEGMQNVALILRRYWLYGKELRK